MKFLNIRQLLVSFFGINRVVSYGRTGAMDLDLDTLSAGLEETWPEMQYLILTTDS